MANKFFSKAELLGRLKRGLGLFYLKLPIEDKDLMDVIDEVTVHTYSIYFPQELTIKLDIYGDKVPNTETYQQIYYIDERHIGSEVKIIDIESVYVAPNSHSINNYYPMNAMDVAGLQMNLDLNSLVNDPITYNYIPPNKIQITNTRHRLGMFHADLLLSHNTDLSSIRPSQIDSFMKLATLDMKSFLYQNLKWFDQVETTFGTINLKIDEWSNAESDKETLLAEWDSRYLANRKRSIYMF